MGEKAMQPQDMDNPLEQDSVFDIYLPEKEEVERLDSLLTEMLARTQGELDRLPPQSEP